VVEHKHQHEHVIKFDLEGTMSQFEGLQKRMHSYEMKEMEKEFQHTLKLNEAELDFLQKKQKIIEGSSAKLSSSN